MPSCFFPLATIDRASRFLPRPRRCTGAESNTDSSGTGSPSNHSSALPLAREWSPPTPAGIDLPNIPTSGRRSSGSDCRSVLAAIIPQPMSTPTAAGMIVSDHVGMTLPTVAPMPRWASGISAKCPANPGARDTTSACCRVASSRMLAQLFTSPISAPRPAQY